MIKQTITLSSDGSISPASVSLGTADDHLVGTLEFIIPEEFTSLGCYARLCFDGKFTAPLIPVDGKITYPVPKSVAENTPVFAELKCYKVTDGMITAKLTSEMLTLYCNPTLLGTTDFPDQLSEPYENAYTELNGLINRAESIIDDASAEYNNLLNTIQQIGNTADSNSSAVDDIRKSYIEKDFISLYNGNPQWTSGMIGGLRPGYSTTISNIDLKCNIPYKLEIYCTPVLNTTYNSNPIFYIVENSSAFSAGIFTVYDDKIVADFIPTKNYNEITLGICTEECKLSSITQFTTTNILYSDTLLGGYFDRLQTLESEFVSSVSRMDDIEYRHYLALDQLNSLSSAVSSKVNTTDFTSLRDKVTLKQNLNEVTLYDTTPTWQRMIGHPLNLAGYYSEQSLSLAFYSGIQYTVRIVCDRLTPIMYYGDCLSVWFTNASYTNLIKFKVDVTYENGAYVGKFTPNTDYFVKEIVMTELSNNSISVRDSHIGKTTITAYVQDKQVGNCPEALTGLTLLNNFIFKIPSRSEHLDLTLKLPSADDGFSCELRFCTGTDGVNLTGDVNTVYFTGDNCTGGTFTPELHTRYQIIFRYSDVWFGEVHSIPDGTGGNS